MIQSSYNSIQNPIFEQFVILSEAKNLIYLDT